MKNIDNVINKEYEIYVERYTNYLDNTNHFTHHMVEESLRILKNLFSIKENIDLYNEEFNDFIFETKFSKFLANLYFNFKNK